MARAKNKKPRIWLKTSEIADMLDIHQTTVMKWIDKGEIPGYRMPGTKQMRRVLKSKFIEWLKAKGHGHLVEQVENVGTGTADGESHGQRAAEGCSADQGEAGDERGAGDSESTIAFDNGSTINFGGGLTDTYCSSPGAIEAIFDEFAG